MFYLNLKVFLDFFVEVVEVVFNFDNFAGEAVHINLFFSCSWIFLPTTAKAVQILVCFLKFCLSSLLPLPLVHLQQVLATNGVHCFISFGAWAAAVVLCQANGPRMLTMFIRLKMN